MSQDQKCKIKHFKMQRLSHIYLNTQANTHTHAHTHTEKDSFFIRHTPTENIQI
jgi:hypothetical protein